MRSVFWVSVFITVMFSAVALPSLAATFHVEKDGSGDYSVIQDAVDAAASGDTILIGPGNFNDGQIVTSPGWSHFTRILVNQAELTLIGSGPNLTILGPLEAWNPGDELDRGVVVWNEWGNRKLHVEGINFVNMAYPIEIFDTESIVVRNCRFSNNSSAIILDGVDSAELDECTVLRLVDNISLICLSVRDFNMKNCEINLFNESDATNLYLQGLETANIDNCVFSRGSCGVLVTGDTALNVNNCLFERHLNYGILVGDAGINTICNTRFLDSQIGLDHRSISGGTLMLNQCYFQNMSDTSIRFYGLVSGHISDCDLVKGERYVVKYNYNPNKETSEIAHFDMTNNWWGTTEPDSIQAWVYDHNDNPAIDYVIDWEPYADESVPTKKTTLGGLKSLYR